MANHASKRRRPSGFTIVELVVASVITALVAGAVVVSLSRILDIERAARDRQEALHRAQAAADAIAGDIRGAIRDGDLFKAQVQLRDGVLSSAAADEILLFVRTQREIARATADTRPTGDVFEVQYRLRDDTRAGAEDDARVLWRRIDAVPDDTLDGGGVVFPLVEGIESVSITAFDGNSWTSSWFSDTQGYPHAIRIEVEARSVSGDRSARAMRVVPIDRVPAPYFRPRLDEGGEEGSG